MYLRICMKTKFCELHFRGRSTLHKIGEFYLSDHARQLQFGQNSILARSKAKVRNWKIIAELGGRRPPSGAPYPYKGTKGNPWIDFLMAIMASGIARGRVRTTTTTKVESRNMAAMLQLMG